MAYDKAGRRIQTAIAVLVGRNPGIDLVQPKHVRAALDLSRSDLAGLVALLIAKGIITEAEYQAAITATAEHEADSYERMMRTVFSAGAARITRAD